MVGFYESRTNHRGRINRSGSTISKWRVSRGSGGKHGGSYRWSFSGPTDGATDYANIGTIRLRWDRRVLGMLETLPKIRCDEALAQKPVIVGESHVLRDDCRNCIPRSLPLRESFGGEGDRGCYQGGLGGYKLHWIGYNYTIGGKGRAQMVSGLPVLHVQRVKDRGRGLLVGRLAYLRAYQGAVKSPWFLSRVPPRNVFTDNTSNYVREIFMVICFVCLLQRDSRISWLFDEDSKSFGRLDEIAKSWITCVNTNKNTTFKETQRGVPGYTSGVRVSKYNWEKIPFKLEGEAFEPEGRVRHRVAILIGMALGISIDLNREYAKTPEEE
ncbi:hypothetical protein Tco_0651451 [Tanacetum coccineum]|uniref:Uncharacterized protein n=1 Tax=Tanacetum coccineum TaxID=301880 RepID=A0ABQ4WUU6_9ASTR